jgi:hypothetical protein
MCKCWVRNLNEEEQFGIRYGAHSLWCPTYREGLDPVDRLNDTDLRQRGEAGTLTIRNA